MRLHQLDNVDHGGEAFLVRSRAPPVVVAEGKHPEPGGDAGVLAASDGRVAVAHSGTVGR